MGFPEYANRHIELELRRQVWPGGVGLGILGLMEYRVRPEKGHSELLIYVNNELEEKPEKENQKGQPEG